MGWIANVKEFILGKEYPFDDFEIFLIKILSEELSGENQKIFLDQIQRFNKVYRETEIAGQTHTETHMYWKKFGKVRRNFPHRFLVEKEEYKLATIEVSSTVGTIVSHFWLVDGALSSIEFESKTEEFRPLSPDSEVTSTVIHLAHKSG